MGKLRKAPTRTSTPPSVKSTPKPNVVKSGPAGKPPPSQAKKKLGKRTKAQSESSNTDVFADGVLYSKRKRTQHKPYQPPDVPDKILRLTLTEGPAKSKPVPATKGKSKTAKPTTSKSSKAEKSKTTPSAKPSTVEKSKATPPSKKVPASQTKKAEVKKKPEPKTLPTPPPSTQKKAKKDTKTKAEEQTAPPPPKKIKDDDAKPKVNKTKAAKPKVDEVKPPIKDKAPALLQKKSTGNGAPAVLATKKKKPAESKPTKKALDTSSKPNSSSSSFAPPNFDFLPSFVSRPPPKIPFIDAPLQKVADNSKAITKKKERIQKNKARISIPDLTAGLNNNVAGISPPLLFARPPPQIYIPPLTSTSTAAPSMPAGTAIIPPAKPKAPIKKRKIPPADLSGPTPAVQPRQEPPKPFPFQLPPMIFPPSIRIAPAPSSAVAASASAIAAVQPPAKKSRKKLPSLVPRITVTLYPVDPTFETGFPMPFISTLVNSRLITRAVLTKNTLALSSLITEMAGQMASFCIPRSANISHEPLYYAIKARNFEAIKLLLSKDTKQASEKLSPYPDLLIENESTGQGSFYMFGHGMRSVGVARGGKEGNEALLKDRNQYGWPRTFDVSSNYYGQIMIAAFEFGYSWNEIQSIVDLFEDVEKKHNSLSQAVQSLEEAVMRGQHKLAGEIVAEGVVRGGFEFNQLHKEALTLCKKAQFSPFQSRSVVKKSWYCNRATPVHFAAINPDPYYLKTLLSVKPEFNILDGQGRTPTHYASTCSAPEPLIYLIEHGVNVKLADKVGKTPLYLAAEVGRLANVRVILKYQSMVESGSLGGGPPLLGSPDASKDSLINHPNSKNSYCPLHIAAANGHADVVAELLNQGADPDRTTTATYDKLTPAMLAARHGHLSVLQLLIEKGDVNIEATDKKGRTALTYAVIDGQGHIVSYLLRMGANNQVKDSSGNTLVHYAAAYGWYFIWLLLLETGCPPNEPNDWKMTPLGIAFLKGHIGLVEEILKKPGIDVNSPIDDTTSQNLLLQTCSSKLSDSFVSRIQFLVEKQKASCTAVDIDKNNALHYLVLIESQEVEKRQNCFEWVKHEQLKSPKHKKFGSKDKTSTVAPESSYSKKFTFEELLRNRQSTYDVIKLLIKNGCDPNAINSNSESPVTLAFKMGCIELIELFLECGCQIQSISATSKSGNTILHHFIESFCSSSTKLPRQLQLKEFISTITIEQNTLKLFQNMVNIKNDDGFTPLHFLLDKFTKTADETTEKIESSNYADLLSFLINELEADVNIYVEESGSGETPIKTSTPLHLAAARSTYSVESVQQLLTKSAELNSLNQAQQTPLIVAIRCENEPAANYLIQAGADVNIVSKNDDESSVLILAGQKFGSKFNIIPSLVSRNVNLKTFEKKTGNSILHLLAMKPEVDSEVILPTVQKLISYGADVMLKNSTGQIPLHLLVNERGTETDVSYDLEELLIKSNPKSLLVQDSKGRIPLHYAFVKAREISCKKTVVGSTNRRRGRKSSPVSNESSENGQNDEPGTSGSVKAPSSSTSEMTSFCKIDPIELVALLTRSMKPLTKSSESIFTADIYKSTPLHYAANCGCIISISLLITELKTCVGKSIDQPDSNGNTPFGLAVWKGSEGAALQFQQSSANFLCTLNTYQPKKVQQEEIVFWIWEQINQIQFERESELKEKCKYSILQEVIQKNQQGLLHLMLEKLATGKGEGIMKAIEASLRAKRLKLALKLLKRAGPEAFKDYSLNFKKPTLFHTLAKVELESPRTNVSASDLAQLVETILAKRVSLSTLDENNSQAIIYAAINWNIKLCLEFARHLSLDELAKLTPDSFNRTPFSAIFWKLIRKPAKIPDELKKWGSKLIGHGSSPNVLTNYPIVLSNYPGIGFLLLDDNNLSKVTSAVSKAYTPLIMAVLSRNYDAVKWLLNIDQTGFAKTVELNAADSFGRTALMYAVKLNDIKMVKLLLNHKSYNVEKDKWPWSDKSKSKKSGNNNNDSFTVTTIPNLSIQDKAGWTVLHHLVSPVQFPSSSAAGQQPNHICFVNSMKILRILTSSIGLFGSQAFELKTKGTNATVLEMAKSTTKYGPIIEHLEEIIQIPIPQRTIAVKQDYDYVKIQDEVGGMVDGTLNLDSSEFIKQAAMAPGPEEAGSSGEVKYHLKPDALCGIKPGHGVLLQDSNTKLPFDCLLTQVDLSFGVHGLYNFYKMQIIKQTKGKDLILLFTRWGRVGLEGQYQKTPFPDEDSAILEFKKIFRSKTGNNWEALNEFQPVPKKYRLVNIERRQSKRQGYMDKVKIDFDAIEKAANANPGKKQKDVVKLIRKLCLIHKPKNNNAEVEDEEYKDEFGFPHGLMDLATLQKGDQILNDIAKNIQNKEKLEKQQDVTSQAKSDELGKIFNSIIDLSEQFFTLIPVHGFSFEKIVPLFDFDKLRASQLQIHRLIHLEFATKLLLAASQKFQQQLNPYELIYKNLSTKIELMDKTNAETQLILQYIHNTASEGSARPKIEAIYRVERQDEMKTLTGCGIGNRWLLWHGTRTKNLLSILHDGLQVVPLGANINGHLFGKGIYFADMFEKSSHYCDSDDYTKEDPTKFMFLCEVALGNIQYVDLDIYGYGHRQPDSVQEGSNSLKTRNSRYEPDPGTTIYWNGRSVPLGMRTKQFVEQEKDQEDKSSTTSGASNYGLDFNEYVIFDRRQVCIRYLVQFRDSN